MGQYWIPVNLDKGEFIDPHKLGSGLKLWEQLANAPGTQAALIVLLAAMPEPRGGGDLDLDTNWHGPERKDMSGPGPMPEEYPAIAARTIGRWAGDRIALVGDYAEDTDLPAEFEASKIYEKCRDTVREVVTDHKDHVDSSRVYGGPNDGKYVRWEKVGPPAFTDISEDVRRVIEHELGGRFEQESWGGTTYKERNTA